MPRKDFAETDWVNQTRIQDISQTENLRRVVTIHDSREDLRTGLEVTELDTVPASLMELIFAKN
jgi:hypothetical protein